MKHRFLKRFGGVILIITIAIITFQFFDMADPNKVEKRIQIKQLEKLQLLSKEKISYRSFNVIFMIRFQDFNCTLCLTDFLILSDSLNLSANFRNCNALYLVERDQRKLNIQKRIIRKWFNNNNIYSPVRIFKNSQENEVFSKSCVLTKVEDYFVVNSLPLGQEKLSLLLNYLRY